MAEKTWEEIVADSQRGIQPEQPATEPAKPAKRKKKEKK